MYTRFTMSGRQLLKVNSSFLIATILIIATFGIALAQYIGSGHFSTGSLTWCHAGFYYNENLSASAQWGYQTDLNLTNDCSDTDVRTWGYDLNDPGLYGYAYICAGSTCDSTTAWNATFTYCEARSNSGELDTWTFSERKFNGMHELGHCWSLAHRSDSTSVMQQGQLSIAHPNSTDENFVNARH